jgi:hypothetical protein
LKNRPPGYKNKKRLLAFAFFAKGGKKPLFAIGFSCDAGGGRSAAAASPALDLVAVKDLVLIAFGAVRALQTADQKDGHSHRNQHSENVFVDRKPMHQTTHTQ